MVGSLFWNWSLDTNPVPRLARISSCTARFHWPSAPSPRFASNALHFFRFCVTLKTNNCFYIRRRYRSYLIIESLPRLSIGFLSWGGVPKPASDPCENRPLSLFKWVPYREEKRHFFCVFEPENPARLICVSCISLVRERENITKEAYPTIDDASPRWASCIIFLPAWGDFCLYLCTRYAFMRLKWK